jgi:hypothetical protein
LCNIQLKVFFIHWKLLTDALNLTAEWLKRHINFEKTTESYHDIVVRAYMEIFDWDEHVLFPEVIKLKCYALLRLCL